MSAKTSYFLSVLSTVLVESVSICARMQRRVNRLHTGLKAQRDDRDFS
ncbi:hypothetical protein SAMN05444279_11011 [Ruegeria intermedia]|uniref:Uncharacterized protein n=1 Tax=Ruegeria intermedia TaxID=996115 RepID=A0A1M4WXQ9_9RHOB|nr:hypothetical protein [Ruegeria intermedia]SHE85843.1 hypothetical protein SAMN05444279_11011 [Ruegeria intermedia]